MIPETDQETPEGGLSIRDLLAVLEPVIDWYQSDEQPARDPLDILCDIVADLRSDRTENETCHQALKNLSACCWGKNLTQSVAGAVELVRAFRESNKRLRDALEAIRVGIENEEAHGLWDAEQILAIIAGAFSAQSNVTREPD